MNGVAAACVCGSVFLDDAALCRKCGTLRPGVCTCGNILCSDAVFCRRCGKRNGEVQDWCKACSGAGRDQFGQPCSCQDVTWSQCSPFPRSEASDDYDEDNSRFTEAAIQSLAATVVNSEDARRIEELEREKEEMQKLVGKLSSRLQQKKEELSGQNKQLLTLLEGKEQSQSSKLQAKVSDLEQHLLETKTNIALEKDAQVFALQRRLDDSQGVGAGLMQELSAGRLQIATLQKQVSDFNTLSAQHSKQTNLVQSQKQDLEEQLREAIAAKDRYQMSCAQAQDKVVAVEAQLTRAASESNDHASEHAALKRQISQLEQERKNASDIQVRYNKDQDAWRGQFSELQQRLSKASISEQQSHHTAQRLQDRATELEVQLCDAQGQSEQDRQQHKSWKAQAAETADSLANAFELSATRCKENRVLQGRVESLKQELDEVCRAKLESDSRIQSWAQVAQRVPELEERADLASTLEAQVAQMQKDFSAQHAHSKDLEKQLVSRVLLEKQHEQARNVLTSEIDDLKRQLAFTQTAQESVTENHQAFQASLADFKQQLQQLLAERESHRAQMATAKMQNTRLEERLENLFALNQQQAQANRALQTHCADLKQNMAAERGTSDQLTRSQAVQDQQVHNLASQLAEVRGARDQLTHQGFADELRITELGRQVDDLIFQRDHGNQSDKIALSHKAEIEEELDIAIADTYTQRKQIEQLNDGMKESHEQNATLLQTILELKAKLNQQDQLLMSLQQQTFAARPAPTIGFKLVANIGGQYFSLFAGMQVEYRLGETVEDDAQPQHRSGLYFCGTPAAAMKVSVGPSGGGGNINQADKAILKCECEGPFVEYSNGKFACSRLTPIEEVPFPSVKMIRCSSAPRVRGVAAEGACAMNFQGVHTMPGSHGRGHSSGNPMCGNALSAEDARAMSAQGAQAFPVGNGRGVARFLREQEQAATGSMQPSWRAAVEGDSALTEH